MSLAVQPIALMPYSNYGKNLNQNNHNISPMKQQNKSSNPSFGVDRNGCIVSAGIFAVVGSGVGYVMHLAHVTLLDLFKVAMSAL